MPSLLLMLVLFLSCLCTPLTISSSTTSATATATVTATISSRQYHHHRRILHQPLFPFDQPFTSAPLPAPAPSPTPHPQPQSKEISPKYPFSSQSPPTDNSPPLSFFPFYPSPPPPPPPPSSTALATFPANISSLILPQSHSPSKPISRKLIAVVVSVSLLSASLITAVAAFLLHHRHHHQFYSTKDDSRTDSLRLYPPNTATSDGNHKPQPPPTPPPLRNVSSTSSEFLYLGTLVSSRDATDNDDKNSLNCNFGTTTPSVSGGGYQRLGSPELRPLPPLPRHHHFQSTQQSAAADSDDQHEEEFFSPRGSTSGSPNRFESSYGRAFEAAQLGSRSSNSRNNSYPSSNSASPTQSQSPTVPLNLSPTSLMSRSPDSVVNFPAPPRPIPPPPPRERKNLSPSPPPERNSGDTQNSPARVSDVSKQNQLSPARKQSVPVKLPPPPPPLPPPRFWETTMGPSQIHYPMTGPPPELVAPSRPVVFQNGETTVLQQNVESVERNEELQRPKLKPLHWDKVRASSDRAMVWDQLKSSSFQ